MKWNGDEQNERIKFYMYIVLTLPDEGNKLLEFGQIASEIIPWIYNYTS